MPLLNTYGMEQRLKEPPGPGGSLESLRYIEPYRIVCDAAPSEERQLHTNYKVFPYRAINNIVLLNERSMKSL
jgi:hypothetical protein